MPPAADRKRRNVHRIVEMFSSLGLPVCDDEDAIRAKRDEQRGTRNRELNSTKGSVAAKAQQWFDDVNALLNRRDELLAYVYDEFCHLADTVLRADLDGGRTNLGADTHKSLRELATSWCGADAELSQRWVGEYLVQRGIKEGGTIDKPRLVDSLKAVARSGRVQISWSLPSSHCDEVRLVRSDDPPNAEGSETIVYQGAETAFLDTSVSPRQHYIYRAYSVYESRQSLTSAVARTRSNRRVNLDSRKLGVAAGVVVVALAGILGYDQLKGIDGFGDFGNGQQGSGVTESPADETPAQLGVNSVLSEPAVVLEAPAHVTLEQPQQAEAAATSRRPAPPQAVIIRPPNIAFAGRSLKLELHLTEPVRQALVDPVLNGVRLKRLELDADPPSIRFMVDELAPDAYQGRASWSFRLASEDGRTTDTVTGSCMVLPDS